MERLDSRIMNLWRHIPSFFRLAIVEPAGLISKMNFVGNFVKIMSYIPKAETIRRLPRSAQVRVAKMDLGMDCQSFHVHVHVGRPCIAFS